MPGEAIRVPLDIDRLEKGTVIPPDTLRRVFRAALTRGPQHYQLALLAECERISDAMEDRGTPATVVVRKEAIHILTDEEAVAHNHRLAKLSVRRVKKSLKRCGQVDRSQLSAATERANDRHILLYTAALAAFDREYRGQAKSLPEHLREPRMIVGKK